MIKIVSFFAIWLSATFAPIPLANLATNTQTNTVQAEKEADKVPKIQVALLLDTSGSMDGLLEQAKSQIWKMVNEFATAKLDGKSPDIEIALYEYGKDDYSAASGHLKQILALTTDLDLVSEKLFELKTNGGSEYCGWVIQDAVENLKWSKSNEDLKVIIIAGNEPFTQGPRDYKVTCKHSITNGIVVNTIFCGNCDEGVRTNWKDGADRADGKYMCIDHNSAVVHVETPFDKDIVELNNKLNTTYIAYGRKGEEKKMRQSKQDENAGAYSQANVAERALSKSSKAYKNEDWDAVDAFKDEENQKDLKTMKEEELPEEMKGMSADERVAFVEGKAKERETIQAEIRELSEKREKFIVEARKNSANTTKNTLDEVMLEAVRKQAEKKNFKFK